MVVYWYKSSVPVNATKPYFSYLKNLDQNSKSQKQSVSEYLMLILPPMKLYQSHSKPDRLILNQRTKSYIPISYIMLLKGKANYTIFILSDGREKVVAHTLKYFEIFLQTYGFQRVHRASMINPNYVKSYNEQSNIITMDNQMNVQISRRRRDNFVSDLREKSIKFGEQKEGKDK